MLGKKKGKAKEWFTVLCCSNYVYYFKNIPLMLRRVNKKRTGTVSLINFHDFVKIRHEKEKIINVLLRLFRILSKKIGKKLSWWKNYLNFTSHSKEAALLLPLLIIVVTLRMPLGFVSVMRMRKCNGITMKTINWTDIIRWLMV